MRPEPGVQFFLKSSKYIDKSPLNTPLMHCLPDIQPCSLFVQLYLSFQVYYLFLLQKGLQDPKMDVQLHVSYVLSLLSTHTFQDWENTHLIPGELLLGNPFCRLALAYPNPWMLQDACGYIKANTLESLDKNLSQEQRRDVQGQMGPLT